MAEKTLPVYLNSTIMATEEVGLEVTCRTPGQPPDAPPPTACDVAALIVGELSVPAPG